MNLNAKEIYERHLGKKVSQVTVVPIAVKMEKFYQQITGKRGIPMSNEMFCCREKYPLTKDTIKAFFKALKECGRPTSSEIFKESNGVK